MNKAIKNLLIIFISFSLVFSVIIVSRGEGNFSKTEFITFGSSSRAIPVPTDSSSHIKRNKFFANYNRFNIKDLIKIQYFVLESLLIFLFICFLYFNNLYPIPRIDSTKKKHFIAKYIKKG